MFYALSANQALLRQLGSPYLPETVQVREGSGGKYNAITFSFCNYREGEENSAKCGRTTAEIGAEKWLLMLFLLVVLIDVFGETVETPKLLMISMRDRIRGKRNRFIFKEAERPG